ncbi:hypothetical protein K466DRAFT_602124 [Polyporus arcularius HHB13444]|uniref:Uncharacterized protein n=1 Tax=Polyporus arcularius HHB13444 TaxID=1314778 RepID=A0A5C3P3R9_9APHY|nr:hypothetical protein K466DRAFT_602124 [Polyporus arcularius HHB13444]
MASDEDHPHLFSDAINLKNISMGLDPDSAEIWNTVTAMFQSLPARSSGRVETIGISGEITLPSQSILDGLESIDACFEGGAFAGLQSFTFRFRYGADAAQIDASTIGEEVLKVTQSKLPELIGRRDINVRVELKEMGEYHRAIVLDYSSQRGD